MDQDNTPRFENEPYQPSSTGPEATPAPGGGAQIYEPNFQPTPGPSFSPPPPVYSAPPQPPKSNSRKIWITILIVVLVLCCCCIVALILTVPYAWNNGDAYILELCRQDPTLPFCQ